MTCLQVQAASLNCGKAHSIFERFVCGQEVANATLTESSRPELIKLDAELNAVYQEALTKHFDPAWLRREQRAWLKARDRCVRDNRGCFLTGLYQDRIDNLHYDMVHPPKTPEEQANARLLSVASPPGSNFAFDRYVSYGEGRGFNLCEALVRWVNHTTPKGDMDISDAYRTVLSMPGFSEPAWQELDMQQHKELFASLVENLRVNAPTAAVNNEIKAGFAGAYRLWMVKEDVDGSPKPETLVAYTQKTPAYGERIWGAPQIVTDNMREVDKQANINLMSLHGVLMHYKDKSYFISASSASVYVRGSGTTCQIHNFKPEGSKK